MHRLDEKFSLLRRRVQHRIADMLHAIDKTTGSTFERRILCHILDRIGADGMCSFLNEETVENLERGISLHASEMEKRGRAEVQARAKVLLDAIHAGIEAGCGKAMADGIMLAALGEARSRK